MRPWCKRWRCRACSQVRKQDWLGRLYRGIKQHGLTQLHYLAGDAQSWAKLRQALHRSGSKFLKVLTGGSRSKFMLLATEPLAGTKPVEPAAALELLAEALRLVPLSKGRPVTCSKGWLPSVPKKNKWRYAGEIPASDQHFEATLLAQAEAGVLRGKILEPKAVAAWMFKDDVPEAERARIRDRLFGNALQARTERPGAAAEEPAPAAGEAV